VQRRGTVSFISAGTLELDGNTIANTESSTVRTFDDLMRLCGRGLALLRSQS
jgi:hypothetical protein